MSSTQAAKLNTSGSPERAERPSGERPEWLQKLLDYPTRARGFLHEVRVEMKQVTWPSQSEVRSTTLVVILTTLFFAVFLYLVDQVAAWGVTSFIKRFGH
jgi:preprotein translocase SecE subunit